MPSDLRAQSLNHWSTRAEPSSNLFTFKYLAFVVKSPYISQLLPYLFTADSQSDLRGCVPSLSPQKFCWIIIFHV